MGNRNSSRVSTELNESKLQELMAKTGLSQDEIKKMHAEFLVNTFFFLKKKLYLNDLSNTLFDIKFKAWLSVGKVGQKAVHKHLQAVIPARKRDQVL